MCHFCMSLVLLICLWVKVTQWHNFHSCRAKPGGVHTTSSGAQKISAVPEADDLIAPGTPIQFDIMLPASEFQDQNRAGGRWVESSSRKFVGGASLWQTSRTVVGDDVFQFPEVLKVTQRLLYNFQEAEGTVIAHCVGFNCFLYFACVFPSWQTH